MAKRIIRLNESELKQYIKNVLTETVMNEMGTVKQNALLRKLTGSDQYDNLSVKDASEKISQLLDQQGKRPATEKQIAYLKRMYPKFADLITPENITSKEASEIIGDIINNKYYAGGTNFFTHLTAQKRHSDISTNLPIFIDLHNRHGFINDEYLQDELSQLGINHISISKDMKGLFFVGWKDGEVEMESANVIYNPDKIIFDNQIHEGGYVLCGFYTQPPSIHKCCYIAQINNDKMKFFYVARDERTLTIGIDQLMNKSKQLYQSSIK